MAPLLNGGLLLPLYLCTLIINAVQSLVFPSFFCDSERYKIEYNIFIYMCVYIKNIQYIYFGTIILFN